jgi:membrane-associated phospholipid phosphatase
MKKDKPIILNIRGIDWISLFFCLWMLVLITIGWNRVLDPLKHYFSYLSIITGILLLLWIEEYLKLYHSKEYCSNGLCRRFRPKTYRAVAFLRSYYPILFYLYFFESVSATNLVFFHDWLDPFFLNIDKAIWGYLPSMQWGRIYDNLWISEIMHGAYFCYYLMIFGLPIYFYIRHRKALDELIFVLSFVFYCCYFIYSWLPVIGGRYYPEAMQWTQELTGGVFTHIMAYIYIKSPHLGGAFPSSHVAIALVLSLMALRYQKVLGWVLLSITFLLSIATVYCHYHWFIDAVFGIITGLLGYQIGIKFYHKISENQNA